MPSIFSPQSTRVVYASRAGVPTTSPASPQSGSAASAQLNAILNVGGPVRLVLDVACRAQQVSIPAGCTIEQIGHGSGSIPLTGIWMDIITNGTNSCILKNANWASNFGSNQLNCANIVDQDITLRGLYLNGQRAAGASGNSTGTFAASVNTNGQFVSPIQFYGVSNLLAEDISICDPCCYHFHCANISYCTFRDLTFLDPVYFASQPQNRITDGLHCNGPWNDVLIDGLKGTTGDDMLALNAADGNLSETINQASGPQAFGGFGNVYFGNGTRTVAKNLFPNACQTLGRYITGNDPRVGGAGCVIDFLDVSNVVGSVVEGGMGSLTIAGFTDPGTRRRCTFSNISLDSVDSNTNDDGFSIGGNCTDITFENVKFRNSKAGQWVQFSLGPDAAVGRLEFNGITERDDSGEASSPSPLISISQGSVDELILNRCSWYRNAATTSSILAISAGTVDSLQVTNCSANNVSNIVSITGGTIGNITSNGITHRNASGNASYALGVTVPQFTAGCSNTAKLISGTAPTSKQTDGTERS
jgi:hypothetical protein